ncbi:DNA mismatch repair endonuclease MutL [Acetonema longum]|uniref:DNA mismatch repair protein MutL n=1 Tax=Acetonema longum DSM 6540 TaxID=1009370 RepID=F7NPD2_9FIRM|nr:DNA mismatch repair endonuclease MutL [Acetonema longum]EGO62094.1 DNA mismatch repair protein MutL [Acetonema longum DSM 6540]
MITPVIKILEDELINQIAAGEVVERPSSVIKELVENSIDAQAKAVEIEIREGGIQLIRVTDDGCGMSEPDARLAVIRHATSKLHNVEDLFRLVSLGFRGEALPSIAAVSRFSLTTRRPEDDLGTLLEIEGGILSAVRETGTSVGTTIMVQDLFFNTPARRKFLKTPQGESSHIYNMLVKLALSQPHIAIKLINNNRLVLMTPGTSDLPETIGAVYGGQVVKDLLPVSYEQNGICAWGYVSKPSLIKSSRQWQTFIVNSRVIGNRMLAKAVDNAYHSMLPHNGYPFVLLNITLPPDQVDVNIHPQKSEIKFRDESSAFRSVYQAIAEALRTKTETHEEDTSQRQFAPLAPFSPVFAATASGGREILRPVPSQPLFHERLENFAPPTSCSQWQEPAPLTEPATVAYNSLLEAICQIESCYIVARGPEGLYLMDQHAAHERILFDRLSRQAGNVPTQQLLVPCVLEFDRQESLALTESLDCLKDLGFTLEQIGPQLFRLTEMPVDFKESDIDGLLREILKSTETMRNPAPHELRQTYYQIAACRAAVKAGDALNIRQMQALLDALMNTDLPYTCPHGRPTILHFGKNELERMFKRS